MTDDEILAALSRVIGDIRRIAGALRERGKGPEGGDPRYRPYSDVRAENEADQKLRDKEAGRGE